MTHLDEQQEQALIRRARQGDREAFGRLVACHQRTVLRIAYHLTGNRQDAEDVTQEAFVKAYQALGQFEFGRPLAPWLYRIARNVALKRLRAACPQTALVEETLPQTQPGPEEAVVTADTLARLRDALAALPAHYRQVIELRHFEGLSYEEIGRVLDEPLSTVKTWLFRARRRLRQALEERSDER